MLARSRRIRSATDNDASHDDGGDEEDDDDEDDNDDDAARSEAGEVVPAAAAVSAGRFDSDSDANSSSTPGARLGFSVGAIEAPRTTATDATRSLNATATGTQPAYLSTVGQRVYQGIATHASVLRH